MKKFTHSDNKVTIFCNNYMIKYLKYVIFNKKYFTTVAPVVIWSIKYISASY